MTAMLMSALPAPVDLDTWARLDPGEGRHELVAGFVTMAPSERFDNRRAAVLLCRIVDQATDADHVAVPDVDVVLRRDPATVRCPDVVVSERGRLRGAARALAADVVLVAEVVSPGSVETDWITKRHEYAAAGIPAYLVVDLRDPQPRLALFTHPGRVLQDATEIPASDDTRADYTVGAGGIEVTVALGAHRLRLTLADLVDE